MWLCFFLLFGNISCVFEDEDFEENHAGIIEQMEMPFDVVRQDVEGEILSDINHIRSKREFEERQSKYREGNFQEPPMVAKWRN